MILRKLLLAATPVALGLSVGNAFADDSSVTLYGILDSAIANIQHADNFDAFHPVANNPTVTKGTQSATGVLNGGMSATRWGIKGQEDMGSGVKALFLLEQGFNVGSGNVSNAALGLSRNTSSGPNMSADSAVSGQFFNRGAYVGLSSDTYGALTLGRHQSFFLDNIALFDPILGSQAFSPLGFSGTYGGGGATDDSRVDNSLKYKVSLGDFTLGALYKFGGVSGSTSAQSAYEFNAVYASGGLAVQLGYQGFKDAFAISNATGTGTVKATAEDTKSFMAAIKYTWEPITVRAGFEREEYENPSNPGTPAVGTTPATGDLAVNSLFGISLAAAPSVTAFPQQKNLNVYWLGAGYAITPAFNLLAGAYHISQNDYDPSGCSSGKEAARCSGGLNYYSLVGDYALSKRTDVYAGIMKSLVSGGPAAAVANTAPVPSENSNRIVALGLHHRF
jgi:predicted porin